MMMKRCAIAILTLVMVSPLTWADTREEKVARAIKDMEASGAKTRASAAEEVGKIAAIKVSYAKPAVEPLMKLLKDKEASVRAAAAEALGKVDEPKKVVPALVELLKDEKSDAAKIGAVTGLGLIGESAREAVKVIRPIAEEARKDKNMRLAQACQRALQNINPPRQKN